MKTVPMIKSTYLTSVTRIQVLEMWGWAYTFILMFGSIYIFFFLARIYLLFSFYTFLSPSSNLLIDGPILSS